MSCGRRPGAGKPRSPLAEYVDGRERVLGRGRTERLLLELVEAIAEDPETVLDAAREVIRR